ncbi:MAG: hypothetical protein ACOY5R_21945 [Pseudomonadota bacterium]
MNAPATGDFVDRGESLSTANDLPGMGIRRLEAGSGEQNRLDTLAGGMFVDRPVDVGERIGEISQSNWQRSCQRDAQILLTSRTRSCAMGADGDPPADRRCSHTHIVDKHGQIAAGMLKMLLPRRAGLI